MIKLMDRDYDVLCCLPKAPIGVTMEQIAMDVIGNGDNNSRRQVSRSIERLRSRVHIVATASGQGKGSHKLIGIGPEDWQKAQAIGKEWWDANH